ncbi:MAG: flagellar biosynthetic protein FliO [Deltaproteobacteria bacterium]|nr:flagellar biosynthetic protein FliO [Deltaproteobacteria bacterium]
MGAFIVVIVLLIIFLKVLAYLTHGRKMGKGGKTFTLKGTMLLDSRRYLAAVEIDGRMLVVGVTPDRLTALGSWPLDSGDGRRLPDTFAFSDAIEGPKALGPPQAKAQGKAQAKASQAPAPKTQPVPQAPSQTRVPPAQPAASQTRVPPQAPSQTRVPPAQPQTPSQTSVPATAVSGAASFADPGATPGPTLAASALAANTGGPGLGSVPIAALGQEPTLAPTLGPNVGPNLGPGRKGAGLGADPRSVGGEGPVLDLSLDDAVFEGPETNDDFLKMFEDENDPKG